MSVAHDNAKLYRLAALFSIFCATSTIQGGGRGREKEELSLLKSRSCTLEMRRDQPKYEPEPKTDSGLERKFNLFIN